MGTKCGPRLKSQTGHRVAPARPALSTGPFGPIRARLGHRVELTRSLSRDIGRRLAFTTKAIMARPVITSGRRASC